MFAMRRDVQAKVIESQALLYWADHPVREVRVVDLAQGPLAPVADLSFGGRQTVLFVIFAVSQTSAGVLPQRTQRAQRRSGGSGSLWRRVPGLSAEPAAAGNNSRPGVPLTD
jgi:hypothetical protein